MADTISWESLEEYISNYSGRTKIQRLLHIAERTSLYTIQAYELALRVLEAETLDSETYRSIVNKLNQHCPDSKKYDDNWAISAAKTAQATMSKLEQELKAYKNNLIKESIRMGQQDIANHHARTGDLNDSLRCLIRNRDFCTTPLHVFQVNLSIIHIYILLGQWAQVQAFVSKLEASSFQSRDRTDSQNQVHVATALVFLDQKKYADAAEKFMQLEFSRGSSFNNIMSMNDVAIITSLLALATFSRFDILKLIENASFKAFLDLEIGCREALEAFHKCRYADCLKLIEVLKPAMIADIFFSAHVTLIFNLIKERSFVQFIGAFNVLPLSRMSEVFVIPVDELERDVSSLVSRRNLTHLKLDLRNGLLASQARQPRETMYRRTFAMSECYVEETERTLLHLNISSSGLLVESRLNHESSSADKQTFRGKMPLHLQGTGLETNYMNIHDSDQGLEYN